MVTVRLPLSKSIVNREQILYAMKGETLSLPHGCCTDISVLHEALGRYLSHTKAASDMPTPLVVDIADCGTAMRFLTAYLASRPGADVLLTGTERMQQRPIRVLVDALRQMGADIEYQATEGYPPLHIKGQGLNMQQPVKVDSTDSTQYASALMLIGAKVETNRTSPYLDLTKAIKENFEHGITTTEYDWSAAAFWYEYAAVWGGEYLLEGLHLNSLQGDKAVARLFERYFGVRSEDTDRGVVISADASAAIQTSGVVDCRDFPDLVPYLCFAAHERGIDLQLEGTASLRLKESDRLSAISDNLQRANRRLPLLSHNDHRIAMAAVAAGYAVDDIGCIRKSYPELLDILTQLTFVVPYRHDSSLPMPENHLQADNIVYVDDEGKGKKNALRRGVDKCRSEYIWFTDIDVKRTYYPHLLPSLLADDGADLYILPLRMEGGDSLLERLQKVEYEALQNLTIAAARKGHAVLCSGANLIVRRRCWTEIAQSGELHDELLSGDDMFLLEAAKRRDLKIAVLTDTRLSGTVSTEPSWRRFLRQRMRWAGKAGHYTDRDINLCGTAVAIANIACMLCPLLFPAKYLIERRYVTHPSWVSALLSLLYPLYMLICLVGGLIRRNKW